jgi:magnesium chelatase subunit H
MPKHILVADQTPVRMVVVTMDTHLAGTAERVRGQLRKEIPGFELTMHAASEWSARPTLLQECLNDIAVADILVVTMLFMEDHFKPVLDALSARRDQCDVLVCAMSASEVMRLTRIGRFTMDGQTSGPMALLKRLRGSKDRTQTAGARQMKMLRRLPRILRFIPGTAQDVRAYFLTLQYWLSGSQENLANMARMLIERYADGPRRPLRGQIKAAAPLEYPEVGAYHPRLASRMVKSTGDLPAPSKSGKPATGTVGVLLLRSYLLAGNTAHYDGVIAALEQRGLTVLPVYAAGLDARPAIDAFFMKEGQPCIDAMVSLTGFSLVGGPAYNDAAAAEQVLAGLDVPYLAAHPLEFQTLEAWGESGRGLLPVENTIMVAIPELDGATGPMVFGGRSNANGVACTGCAQHCTFSMTDQVRDMHSCVERAGMLADRVTRLVALRRTELKQRRVAVVLFNFPPNAGNTGTAAYLSVFQSLFNTLKAMQVAGYSVELPNDVDELRSRIIHGNAASFGADANVHHRISVDQHVREETWLNEIEAQWGPAPGKQLSDGSSILVLGARFGNVLVGIQPAFGYEGDPMRLLFEKGFAPTHAFSAFYRYLRQEFKAHSVLHFGTHGSLEFMPGKQAGMSASCWPDRLIGDLPNIYLYASNNPSEGAIAKRRSAATLVSYMTPPIAHSGLYAGLADLKKSIERWRAESTPSAQKDHLTHLIQAQAAAAELAPEQPAWEKAAVDQQVGALHDKIFEIEYSLIPDGLHVVGEVLSTAQRRELLGMLAEPHQVLAGNQALIAAIAEGCSAESILASADLGFTEHTELALNGLKELTRVNRLLSEEYELPALLRALNGQFTRPAPGGDVLRNPEVLPTGRNIHGFDPFRIPSAFAVADGALQAQRLLDTHFEQGHPLPESIALVLWGTDNLKTEGAPIAQVLALMGARPRFDSYGRLAGASLIPLEELGRPRIDVVVTLSGIFRDLLPLQIKLMAEAAFLAASADEPMDRNFVRKHARAYQLIHGGDLETAALRVFGNADGAYGSNVNHLVENGRWSSEDELAQTYMKRKSFAYGRSGRPVENLALLQSALSNVELTYQNLDSVELGVTTVDNYFDTLGGITRAVKQARGGETPPVYIGDQTTGGEGRVRTLSEQVALESRTRMLNPKWYEGMLKHGYEGVRQIEVHVTNTMGWSATTGQVQPWIYQRLTEVFMLDPVMRERLASLNPTASAKVADRLLEARQRHYWEPDQAMLEALQQAGEELEDRLEGVFPDTKATERLAA